MTLHGLSQFWRTVQVLVVAGLAAVVVAAPLRALRPMVTERDQAGLLGLTGAMCERIGPRAAVVFVNNPSLNVLSPAAREFCGAEVAVLPADASAGEVRALEERWRTHGRSLFVVASPADSGQLDSLLPGAQATAISAPNQNLEVTLAHRPSRIGHSVYTVLVAPVSGGTS